jgi:hypothetical protein
MEIDLMECILPDDSIVAVGIDYIKVVIGGLNVFGQYDFKGEVRNYKFQFNHEWQHTSVKELEEFIQIELSKSLRESELKC